jgi:hypothetical protein
MDGLILRMTHFVSLWVPHVWPIPTADASTSTCAIVWILLVLAPDQWGYRIRATNHMGITSFVDSIPNVCWWNPVFCWLKPGFQTQFLDRIPNEKSVPEKSPASESPSESSSNLCKASWGRGSACSAEGFGRCFSSADVVTWWVPTGCCFNGVKRWVKPHGRKLRCQCYPWINS